MTNGSSSSSSKCLSMMEKRMMAQAQVRAGT
jgi:hypothetical protein